MKKLEKIELNKEYKYDELCYLLDEEWVEGNSRYAQYKRWDKYFEWHTKGSTRAKRFIVTKIHPQIKVESYSVNGITFATKRDAEEYIKSL